LIMREVRGTKLTLSLAPVPALVKRRSNFIKHVLRAIEEQYKMVHCRILFAFGVSATIEHTILCYMPTMSWDN
jgi:hypothetical protein